MLHNNNLKTFFLFPQKLIFEEIAEVLVSEQNEAFVLNNHVEFRDALKIFNENSIAFINIDSVLTESQWIEYIRDIRNDSHFSRIRIGILSFNNDQRLIDVYLNELKIDCGYHLLSRRTKKYEEDIRRIVGNYRDKFGNKILRLDFDQTDPVNYEIKIRGQILTGRIDALSSAAMSLTLTHEKLLSPALELNEITLIYRDLNCRLIGTVIGNSKLNKKQFIIKFQKLFEDFHQKTLFNIIFTVLNNRLKELVR
ncbi:hypothetical protein [Spirochaeta isovalerica]|uniref:Uncharacterized protein n=1 Tax=Spirochaeta isovalerica TaxID=150 RepID=A0A841R723_9SPIO|nr:hypothetical protein [Spirochaeta isovalerica]MBB6478840.1 hypothetical protein [Spirochaeta isovalerica]